MSQRSAGSLSRVVNSVLNLSLSRKQQWYGPHKEVRAQPVGFDREEKGRVHPGPAHSRTIEELNRDLTEIVDRIEADAAAGGKITEATARALRQLRTEAEELLKSVHEAQP